MRRGEVTVGVLRIEGTNSEDETAESVEACGGRAELVHMNQLDASKVDEADFRRLDEYHALVFPGGFSAGDYIRAGAIWAARMKARHGKELEAFVREGRPVLGVCNGFQVLVELGLLPNLGHAILPEVPEAVLHRNDSAHYECRPVLLRHDNRARCGLTRRIPTGKVGTFIAAHGEGKLLYPRERQEQILRDLDRDDRVVFRYVDPEGNLGAYPWNPNGAPGGIAGITNEAGNVLGLMPHPERAFYGWQHPEWTRGTIAPEAPGDGRAVFEGLLDYCEKRL